MATINCPVCGALLEQGPVCPVCGWDTSADSELWPTLFSAEGSPSREVRGEECRARAAEAAREALYLRFGRTVFAGQADEAVENCAEAEDPAEAVRRLAALLGVALPGAPEAVPPRAAGADAPVSVSPDGDPGQARLSRSEPRPLQGGASGEAAAPASVPMAGTQRRSYFLRPEALLQSAAEKDWIRAVRFQVNFRGLRSNYRDVSEARDGSVLAGVVEEAGQPTLLICGEKGVYAPEDCSGLFLDYRQLRSVDFGGCFHTEYCRDMSAMFFGCLSLEYLDMSGLDASGVTDARAMFSNCVSLTRADLPRGLASIQAHMFERCAGLSELRIPEGVGLIGDYAFCGCTGLDAPVLPESVTAVGRYAFKDCTGLKRISLPTRLTELGDGAFWGCAGLTGIQLPAGLSRMGRYALQGCAGLRNIVLPRQLTALESGVFRGCAGLNELVVPASVTRIEARAFTGCADLKTVYFTGSPAQWENAVEKPNEELEKAMIQYSI